mmetsp:Transcript_14570/g.20836  ORF Transcript_14570/g.20836 Transcript_14570/m.20836 type:complete len:174 (-) Transcript_14570:89-610(-)
MLRRILPLLLILTLVQVAVCSDRSRLRHQYSKNSVSRSTLVNQLSETNFFEAENERKLLSLHSMSHSYGISAPGSHFITGDISVPGSHFNTSDSSAAASNFNFSDCSSYSVEWLIDLAQTCNTVAVKLTNTTSLAGCVCASAELRFDNEEISCSDSCPESCDVCDACLKLRCG